MKDGGAESERALDEVGRCSFYPVITGLVPVISTD
jgi:hypothetical protein